jgi:3'-phosphoadenosine 5'-phosphosulfate (PAPS) 3'-phosphatase
MELRGKPLATVEASRGQLKTDIDHTLEQMIVDDLQAAFGREPVLGEESFGRASSSWEAPPAYWTVDALDGTRSFVEGFEGFCVQVAYIEEGKPQLAVVYEPVRRAVYWAHARQGAFRESSDGAMIRLSLSQGAGWPEQPRFIDSTPPTGLVGEALSRMGGRLVICGSIGLKLCRVADGSADVFAKALTFALWDTAPGDLILREAGGRLGLWTGEEIPYRNEQVYCANLLACPTAWFDRMGRCLVAEGAIR